MQIRWWKLLGRMLACRPWSATTCCQTTRTKTSGRRCKSRGWAQQQVGKNLKRVSCLESIKNWPSLGFEFFKKTLLPPFLRSCCIISLHPVLQEICTHFAPVLLVASLFYINSRVFFFQFLDLNWNGFFHLTQANFEAFEANSKFRQIQSDFFKNQESYTQNWIEKVRTIPRVAYNWLMFPVRFRTKQP